MVLGALLLAHPIIGRMRRTVDLLYCQNYQFRRLTRVAAYCVWRASALAASQRPEGIMRVSLDLPTTRESASFPDLFQIP